MNFLFLQELMAVFRFFFFLFTLYMLVYRSFLNLLSLHLNETQWKERIRTLCTAPFLITWLLPVLSKLTDQRVRNKGTHTMLNRWCVFVGLCPLRCVFHMWKHLKNNKAFMITAFPHVEHPPRVDEREADENIPSRDFPAVCFLSWLHQFTSLSIYGNCSPLRALKAAFWVTYLLRNTQTYTLTHTLTCAHPYMAAFRRRLGSKRYVHLESSSSLKLLEGFLHCVISMCTVCVSTLLPFLFLPLPSAVPFRVGPQPVNYHHLHLHPLLLSHRLTACPLSQHP